MTSARRAAVWIALLAGLVGLQHVLSARRPPPVELRVSLDIAVTSLADDGPGTLREAIFSAATVPGRSRIRLPAGRLTLQTPLPPIVTPHGVVIEGTPDSTEIDASAIETGAALDLDAPNSAVTGVRIVNAPGQAIVARQSGLIVRDSSFLNCNTAVHAAEGVGQVLIERTTFADNRIGVRLQPASGRIEIHDNRFSGHQDAAIWSVRQRNLDEPLTGHVAVARNRFGGDRLSLVLANTPVTVEHNEFVSARDAAVLLLGEGAVVRNNRIRDGDGVGLIADGADDAVVDSNEINRNRAIGVLVRSSSRATIRNNRLYQNGYGLAFVFGRTGTPNLSVGNIVLQHPQDGVIVIGASPVLRENRVMNSGLAGLRILDYYSRDGVRTPAEPLLQENRLEGNAANDLFRGEYRAGNTSRASR